MNNTQIDHLYTDGRLYDLMYGSNEPSPASAFLIEEAERFGGPVLELACGTGNLALPLAQHGLQVTGLDRSPQMLREARCKSAEANLDVEWLESDMRHFDLGCRFSLIVLLGNALAHLLTTSDFDACMASVRGHLRPNGHFLLNGFMPDLSILRQRPEERHSFSEFNDPTTGEQVIVTYGNHYEADSQINRIITYYTYPGRPEQVGGPLDLRIYYPQELDALLCHNGFHIENKFGTFEREPFGQDASTQLFICSLTGAQESSIN